MLTWQQKHWCSGVLVTYICAWYVWPISVQGHLGAIQRHCTRPLLGISVDVSYMTMYMQLLLLWRRTSRRIDLYIRQDTIPMDLHCIWWKSIFPSGIKRSEVVRKFHPVLTDRTTCQVPITATPCKIDTGIRSDINRKSYRECPIPPSENKQTKKKKKSSSGPNKTGPN